MNVLVRYKTVIGKIRSKLADQRNVWHNNKNTFNMEVLIRYLMIRYMIRDLPDAVGDRSKALLDLPHEQKLQSDSLSGFER
jgi:hypothetical protein